jgi:hypothetical protein
MTASLLPEALRACAAGIYTHEAGVSLLIANRTSSAATTSQADSSLATPPPQTAAVDWAAAIAALDTGEISCSGGEQRILRLAASIPVRLSDTITGLDHRNASLVARAIAHATGHANLKPDKT